MDPKKLHEIVDGNETATWKRPGGWRLSDKMGPMGDGRTLAERVGTRKS